MKSFFSFLFFIIPSFPAMASVGAVGEPNVVWTKNKIHVCWYSGEYNFKDEVKKSVQQIVEQEYSLERVGITFFGWEDCSMLTAFDYDLMIFQDREGLASNPTVEPFRKINAEGFSVLGQGSVEQKKVKTNLITNEKTVTEGFFNRNLTSPIMYLMYRPIFRIFSNSFQGIEELQFTALHEFGHVAGLRHEHIRSEAKDDPNCKNLVGFKWEETVMDTAHQYGDYDPNSIMNYCWGATLATNGNVVNRLPNLPDKTLYTESTDLKTKQKSYEIKVGLSAKDVATLNQLYPK